MGNSYLPKDVLCGLLREFSLQTSHSLDFSDFILNCMKKKLKKIIYKNSILCQWVPKYKQCQSVKTTYELLNLSLTKCWTPSSDTLTPVARDVFECLVQEWFVSCQSLEEFLLAISGWEKCSRKGLNLIKCLNNNLKFTFKPNYSIW